MAADNVKRVASRSSPAAPARPRRALVQAIAALRPEEWTKNLLVFATVVFSGRFDEGEPLLRSIAAFAAFCAVASAGYLLNDLLDAPLDRRHPMKRSRPIASGALRSGTAAGMAVALAAAGIAAAFLAGPATAGVVAAYGVATASYSLWLKHVVILDVMVIAGCFLLRVAAGAVTVEVEASEWLLVCTACLALFLGFTKRRQEAASELHAPRASRPVLEHYSLPFLDQMVAIVSTATVISYAIYAVDSPIVGDQMLATAPMVLYGVFRYLYLIYDRADTRSAAQLVTRDPGIVSAAIVWAAAAIVLIYF